ncbi:sigma-70 family RNA polymerase sigma factor [Aquisphaera insulae]|uniref:sigma-70 family RNA polymerase sigma factor n=1 Tax=Aquisphaera insulae TaxID=2712864 RepID=UPI0013EC2B95|nr:sigma-70 family RNA polymerase sigma factor [Aquisphaera insulae]
MTRQALAAENSRDLGILFGAGAIGGRTDRELIERFLNPADRGDAESAFEALVRRHGPMVERVCRSVLGRAEDVDDAFQATFLVLARRAGSIRDRDSLASWLFGVALRVSRHLRAAAARRRAVEIDVAEPRSMTSAPAEDLCEVFEEVDRLPEHYRSPIVLCYLEGRTHDQAARELACPLRTLQTRLLRAKEKLRSRLVRRGLAPAMAVAGLEALGGRRADAGAMATSGFITSTTEEAARAVMESMGRSALRRLIGLAGVIATGLGLLAFAFLAVGGTPDEKTLIVTGRVLDEAGKPVAGASIWMPWQYGGALENSSRASSDAEGRFTLLIPGAWAAAPLERRATIVWAYSKGHSIATATAYDILNGKPGSLEFRLGAATDTAFLVVGIDGRPRAGAMVEPYHFLTPVNLYAPLPEGLRTELRVVTEASGLASLPAMPRQGFRSVMVTTKEEGVQEIPFVDKDTEPALRSVTLRAAGRVEGRLVTDRLEWARGVTIYLRTEEDRGQFGSLRLTGAGTAVVQTGDDGTFTIPAIASGTLSINCSKSPPWSARPVPPQTYLVQAGETTYPKIPLAAAVKVRGSIRVKGSGQPIAGASINIRTERNDSGETVASDKEGHFEGYVLPGRVTMQVIAMSGNFVQPRGSREKPIQVAEGLSTFELQPLEVVPTRAIEGKLLDGKGQPLAKGRLAAKQGEDLLGYGMTDDHGAFSLFGVPEGPIEGYQAYFDDAPGGFHDLVVVSKDPLVLRDDSEKVPPPASSTKVTIRGQVVDDRGEPVQQGPVVLNIEIPDGVRNAPGDPPGFVNLRNERVKLTTDQDGRYRAERVLKPGAMIRAIGGSEPYTLAGSKRLTSDGKSPVVFEPIRVERLRSISGVVTDTDGKPLLGARVKNWGNPGPLTMAIAGQGGRFSLGGLTRSTSRLLVEAIGYRSHGHDVGPDVSTMTIRLRRQDQPPEGTIRPKGTGLSREETLALARRVIDPIRETILDEGDRDLLERGLETLTKLDPDDALRRCLANESPWNQNAVRIAAVHSLMFTAPDEATTIIPTITNNFWRPYTRFELFDSLAPDRIGLRKTLLMESLLDARREGDPGRRAPSLLKAAGRLLDLGETEQARKVIDEAMALVPNKGDADVSALRYILPTLARVDLKAAVNRIPAAGDERALNDLRGAIAGAAASSQPAEAERLLGELTQNNSTTDGLLVSVRMARADLPRARRIAARIKLANLRGLALGRMASAIHDTNPAAARELLEEAFRTFPEVLETGDGYGVWGLSAAANMAAALLPVVERVQRDRISEFVERARALRWYPRTLTERTISIPDTSDLKAIQSAAALAAQLVPYDRELARSIAGPILDHLREPRTEVERIYLDFYRVLPTLALADPRGAAGLVEAIPEDGNASLGQTRSRARLIVAEALAAPESRWDAIIKRGSIDLEIAEREE